MNQCMVLLHRWRSLEDWRPCIYVEDNSYSKFEMWTTRHVIQIFYCRMYNWLLDTYGRHVEYIYDQLFYSCHLASHIYLLDSICLFINLFAYIFVSLWYLYTLPPVFQKKAVSIAALCDTSFITRCEFSFPTARSCPAGTLVKPLGFLYF